MIHRPSKRLRVGDCLADIQEAILLIGAYTAGRRHVNTLAIEPVAQADLPGAWRECWATIR